MYRNSEYAAAKNLTREIRLTVKKEYAKILVRSIISPRRLIDGGAAILAAENINHQNVIAGNNIIIPLVINMLRVFVVSYVMLARANIHEEHRPWASIIVRAPCHPQVVFDIMPPVARPMWLTEEYAIRDFTSVWRRQINLVIVAPTKLILMTRCAIFVLRNNIKQDSRRRP